MAFSMGDVYADNANDTTLELELDDDDVTIYQEVTLTATLTDDDDEDAPINEAEINFYRKESNDDNENNDDWDHIGYEFTDEEGKASFTYTPFEAGVFDFKAVFEGIVQQYQESESEEKNFNCEQN